MSQQSESDFISCQESFEEQKKQCPPVIKQIRKENQKKNQKKLNEIPQVAPFLIKQEEQQQMDVICIPQIIIPNKQKLHELFFSLYQLDVKKYCLFLKWGCINEDQILEKYSNIGDYSFSSVYIQQNKNFANIKFCNEQQKKINTMTQISQNIYLEKYCKGLSINLNFLKPKIDIDHRHDLTISLEKNYVQLRYSVADKNKQLQVAWLNNQQEIDKFCFFIYLTLILTQRLDSKSDFPIYSPFTRDVLYFALEKFNQNKNSKDKYHLYILKDLYFSFFYI